MLNFFIKSILAIIYILFFIPIGIFAKIFNLDILELKINPSKDSYWNEH